jgi:hypothetical protein
MALVGRRDGHNFGYGSQLSYAGPQALKDMFGGGHYGTVKAHSDPWRDCVSGAGLKRGPGSTMRGRLTARCCRTMPHTFAAWLSTAT